MNLYDLFNGLSAPPPAPEAATPQPSTLARFLGIGDPEAAGAVQSSQAMAPAVQATAAGFGRGVSEPGAPVDPNAEFLPGLAQFLGHMAGGTYETARNAGEALMGQRDLSPQDALMASLFGVGAARPEGSLGSAIKAYHGSPYDFNQFDLSKVGTGEGAQAYGHGLYFAENPNVAKSYKETLGAIVGQTPAENIALNAYSPRRGFDSAISEVSDAINHFDVSKMAPSRLMEYQNALGLLNEWKKAGTVPSSGRMYEVAINAEPDQFLNWDKPLAAQPPQIQDMARKNIAETGAWFPGGADSVPGGLVYDLFRPSQRMRPSESAQAASETLRDAGIPGIRYLDQGSRGAGEGTNNYVVFDPKIIEILRKYGLAGLLGGAGAVAANNPYDAGGR